jgi:hypothetical protein
MRPSPQQTGAARRCALAFAVLGLAVVSGCLMDTNLDATGGGTMTVKYRLTNASQLNAAKKRMQSSAVKLVSAQIDPAKWATFAIKFADITKLSTTEYFTRATFSVSEENGIHTLKVTYVNPDAVELPEDMAAYFGRDVTIAIQFPGPIVDSNATKTEGNRATWNYTLKDISTPQPLIVQARYKVGPVQDAAGQGAAGQAPEGTPPADGASAGGEKGAEGGTPTAGH